MHFVRHFQPLKMTHRFAYGCRVLVRLEMNLENVKKLVEEQEIASIDLKYADLIGNWYHISFPPRRLDHVSTTASRLMGPAYRV